MTLYLTLSLFYLATDHEVRYIDGWQKSKCFEANFRPFCVLLLSNRCSLTPSIRQYIVCSCTTDIDDAMPPSLTLLYGRRRPLSSLKSWGRAEKKRSGTKIRQSIVIATFAAFVSLTSKLYLYCTVDKMPTITGTTFALANCSVYFCKLFTLQSKYYIIWSNLNSLLPTLTVY